MFKPQDIKQLMKAKDFRPFAIHTSDGVRFEITNHDMMMIGHNFVEIGLDIDADGIVGRFVRCSILHITRIEELQAA